MFHFFTTTFQNTVATNLNNLPYLYHPQVVICTLIAFSTGQYQKPSKDAAILEEARYLAVNGQFGSTYKQDDGVEFKEESDGQGNRKGSYSYIDPTGQRRTVTYTAGKDGFRATGDHIPVPPVPQAPVAPAAPAIPSNSIQQTGQYNPEDDYQDDSQSQYKPSQDYNYNNYQYNAPNTQYQPQYNPVQFQYRSPALSGVPSPSIPAAAPASYPSVPSYNQYTSSEPPHRFFPPGKLSLNRSPDGFSYTFNKV